MTVAFHPPGESHAETLDGAPVASFNVEIGAELLYHASELAGPLDQPAEFHGGEVPSLALRLFHDFCIQDSGSALALESLALEILAASAGFNLPAGDASIPRWLAEARDLLDMRFREPLTLRNIAGEAGVHPVYFAAAFRCSYRCSVGEYLRRRRLEYARRKLTDPEIPLAEIAFDAGFADQSHLTRTLKRYTGKTPREYRTFLRFKTA
jgi:AraC family transcriptional regulator